MTQIGALSNVQNDILDMTLETTCHENPDNTTKVNEMFEPFPTLHEDKNGVNFILSKDIEPEVMLPNRRSVVSI